MNTQEFFIFPFGANAKEALDCLKNTDKLLGFIDDNPDLQGKTFAGFEIYPRDILQKFPQAQLLAVPANPQDFWQRPAILESFKRKASDFLPSLVHSSCHISRYAKIGYNCLFMANVVISAGVEIGNHVIILPNTTLHHDTKIEAFTWIGSGVSIAGGVIIGQNCWISSGSTLLNNISIGEKTLVGLGSTVLQSFESHVKIAGSPAKIITKS